MEFSPSKYTESVNAYMESWQVMDATLYRLCRENPGHETRDAVHAKLWIIGRTYATGIERKIPTANTQGSSLTQLADRVLDNRDKVSRIFARLADIAEPLSAEKLRDIVELHGRLQGIIRPLLRKKQSCRAFVSKYMHFHCPAVPIIDTYAAWALRKLVRWHSDLAVFDMPTAADEEYGWFVMRFWRLYQQARDGVQPISVKLLDNYLLHVAEGGH